MEYVAPDFERIALMPHKAFTSYTESCVEGEGLQWNYTQPCDQSPNYEQVYTTFTALWPNAPWGCYINDMP